MYLEVSQCKECGACTEVCEHALTLMKCDQCNECVRHCPKNAFYEVSRGVYAIDEEKCDGCGKCAKACEKNAIVIVNKKAKKCDLCGECVSVCPSRLKIVHSKEEETEIREVLGWEKTDGEYETNAYWPSYDEVMLLKDVANVFKEQSKEEEVNAEKVFSEYCEETGTELEEEQKDSLLTLVKSEVEGLSFLDFMLCDDELEEIAVNGFEAVRVFHRKRGWLKADVRLVAEKKAVRIVNRIAKELGRRITCQKPRLNATLPDGSRLHAAIPPVVKEPVITIRKFSENPFSPKDLLETNTVSLDALVFLWTAMQCDLNVIVAGNTGSGKTTTLNALSAFIPLKERVIIVEETPEIAIPHQHCVRLVVNKELGIGMKELVSDTLRMRPDRLLVGEVRTAAEVKALMNTMLAGQGKGSIATFHALSSEEALTRLRGLGVGDTDLNAIDLVVVQRRWNQYDPKKKKTKEMRRITEISEVVNGKACKFFEYDYKKDLLKRSGKSRAEKKISDFFGLSEAKLKKEYARREKFVKAAQPEFKKFVEEVNETLFKQ